MSSLTPNFGFILPSVADPTDADLWGGMLNSNFTLLDTLLTDFAEKLPVGSLYFNYDDSTNPATLLGYGTWVAFGAGRVIVGVGTGTDVNGDMVSFSAATTGGEYNHTLTLAETPAHRHLNVADVTGSSGFPTNANQMARQSNQSLGNNDYSVQGTATDATIARTSSVGSDGEHNNIQPYVTVYVWRRSA